MRRTIVVVLAALLLVLSGQTVDAQARKPVRKSASSVKSAAVRKAQAKKPARRAAPQTRDTTRPADVICPQVLGSGVGSRLEFCDVMTGRTPAEGVRVTLPPHKGVLTLSFDLHNRHTYSDQEVAAGKGFASYTATVAVVAPDSTILGRGVVQSDFRTARDLLDRISGGAGPRGVKAVAPVGTERIRIEVPEDVDEASLLGERLTVVRFDGTQTFSFTGPSRPIALISNVNVTYVPGKKPPVKKAPARKKR